MKGLKKENKKLEGELQEILRELGENYIELGKNEADINIFNNVFGLLSTLWNKVEEIKTYERKKTLEEVIEKIDSYNAVGFINNTSDFKNGLKELLRYKLSKITKRGE